MSGRFVIIVNVDNETWLFHDAAGLRQVLYCKDKSGRIWCASQAETLAERLEFSLNTEVLDYRDGHLFAGGKSEFWLVNNRTPYTKIFHLLPNHYLDLVQGRALRYWPAKNCIRSLSVQEGISLSIPILVNSIEAASKKFDLKMGISAGIDSRKTLAASREVKERIFYFTIEHNINGVASVDIKIPRRLLPKLGIQHHILEEEFMDDAFRSFYNASATFARENKGNIAYTLFRYFGPEFTLLNSNTSEISQCNYWLPKSKLDGEGLAIITGLYHSLAISEFDKWLKEAKSACEEAGLNVLALFHWEQRAGRWASAAFNEYDIVHESFTPYNNRLLNRILLGINERYRRNRLSYVGLRQIKSMWPEALKEPINPADTVGGKINEFVRRKVLHKYITPWIPIYEFCKFIKRSAKAVVKRISNPN